MAIGIDCQTFDFIDAPSPAAIEIAIDQLKLLGAVKQGKVIELTPLGRNMAKFPLDPKYSKMLLTAPSFGCLEEVGFSQCQLEQRTFYSMTLLFQMLSLVAVLSGEDVFQNFFDSERRAQALTAHAKFENKHGDHLTLLNVYKAFSKNEKVNRWCHENFLNSRNLTYAVDVRKQLNDICQRLDLEFSSCGNHFDQVIETVTI